MDNNPPVVILSFWSNWTNSSSLIDCTYFPGVNRLAKILLVKLITNNICWANTACLVWAKLSRAGNLIFSKGQWQISTLYGFWFLFCGCVMGKFELVGENGYQKAFIRNIFIFTVNMSNNGVLIHFIQCAVLKNVDNVFGCSYFGFPAFLVSFLTRITIN